MSADNKITIKIGPIDVVCGSCGGTGLFQGVAERGGCAVVCDECKGTGSVTYMYERTLEKFLARKPVEGIERVFAKSCGYFHGPEDVTTEEGKLIEFSKAGCTYEEWSNGARPKPVKTLYCPYAWTSQEMQNREHEDNAFYKTHCQPRKNFAGCISDCSNYPNKAECWAVYDKMNEGR